MLLNLIELHVNQEPIPKALQDVKRGSAKSIEKSKPEDIPVNKVRHGTHTDGQTRIDFVPDPPSSFVLTFLVVDADVVISQNTVLYVEQINDLACRVVIVLIDP